MKEQAISVVRQLQKAGFETYFAGGSVRDQLLGLESKDIDIATGATPEQVQKLFSRVTDLQGACFGVVRVLVDEYTFEVATFRRDGPYQDGRRPEYVEYTSAEEDARRRDFTINGLFYDPIADKLIDFVGGQADLEARLIRAIGDPVARFTEDKLRLLRAVRFAANLPRKDRKPFIIETNTWAAMCQLAPEIACVAVERVRDELDKIWAGARPASVINYRNWVYRRGMVFLNSPASRSAKNLSLADNQALSISRCRPGLGNQKRIKFV